jgi:enoyl-[acyl-carrier protein] reductase/trans-2-enoyl-CoA reductase (NAD+)
MKENLLAKGATTMAYSYIGPELTYSIYKNGTIGKAKENLLDTSRQLDQKLKAIDGQALISVNKALVTQASAAIPVVPLYISLLYKLMKAKGTHEGCIEQAYRLFKDNLYSPQGGVKDAEGMLRLDNLEMQVDIQQKIAEIWPTLTSENVEQLTDLQGYRDDFYKLFGFNLPGIDYSQEVNPDVKIDA